MFRVRAWVALSLALLLVLIVWIWGDDMLDTAWGNIGLNMIADFFFVVCLTVAFGLLYRGMIVDARRFFGVDDQTPIQVYISRHEDETTVSGGVLTGKEYEIADELKSALKKHFPGAIAFWARLFGVDLEVPEIVIKGSPLEEVKEWPYAGGLILIGGPTRNKLAKFYLRIADPWVTFDDNKKKFLVRREGQTQREEREGSGSLAVLQRSIVDGRVVVFAFGFGEHGTCAAVRYLANEWRRLAKKYPDKGFAHLLQVDGAGQIRVLEEFA